MKAVNYLEQEKCRLIWSLSDIEMKNIKYALIKYATFCIKGMWLFQPQKRGELSLKNHKV